METYSRPNIFISLLGQFACQHTKHILIIFYGVISSKS